MLSKFNLKRQGDLLVNQDIVNHWIIMKEGQNGRLDLKTVPNDLLYPGLADVP